MNTKHLLLTFILLTATVLQVPAQRYIEQQTAYTQQTLQKGVSKELADSRTANISQVQYRLTFNIPADRRQPVTGTAVITFNLQERSDVVLDFQGGFSGDCLINGKKRTAPYKEEHIVLPMKQMRSGLNTAVLTFTSQNTALNRHENYMYTLFVPDHARSCFPCFDQPDLRARYTTTLNVPDGWKTMVSDSQSPLPTYLYSFVAGDFQEKTSQRGGIPMRALYLETDAQKTCQLDHIFDEAGHALQWMESYTGLKCPFRSYGMVILPGYQFGGMEHPGAIQLNDRRVFLSQNPSQEDRLRRTELIAHETAHLWFGDVVSLKWFDDVWTKEVFANFMASKITRRQFSKVDHDLNFIRTYQTRAIAIDRTDGTHPIAQSLTNQNEAAMLYDNIIYDKAPVMMRMMEQMMGTKKMQAGLQRYLRRYYFKNASWDDLIGVLDREAPEAGIRQMSEVWVKQKGMPTIHTAYQDGKLIISQTDPYGRGLCWRQTFDIRIVNDLGSSRTITVDMREPTMTFDLGQAPSYIIPNASGSGYGRFTLDNEYTLRLPKRLIITRDDLQRYALLLTLHDNYLMGRVPASYFGELHRNMMKEKNPLIIQTCIDHMFKIAFDQPGRELQTLEQCIMDLLPENRSDECRRAIVRKMAVNATSPEVLDHIYRLWNAHDDPLFDEHDYMEMAYRLAIMRPEEWQRIIDTERGHLTSDLLRQEFDYVSRACTPDHSSQLSLFNALLKPENRQHEPWALHVLRLLNADVREPGSNVYIPSSLNSLEYLQQTSDIFFSSDWLAALLAGHKSAEARQQVEQFLRDKPDLRPQLRNKILEAAWPLMNKRR
jgi:aminopeptidase N